MEFQTPKGTRDFLPDEMAKRRAVFDACRAVFEKYGFGEVDTPAFESLELLTAKGSLGDEAVKDIYRFEDKSQRKLGLRYDLTVPMVRLFLSQKFPRPVKWYSIGKVWRYEDIAKGRWREFSQCDVEIIGSPLPEADVEVLAVAIECLLALGLKDIEVRINSRKIMDAMAEKLGITRREEVFRALDKLDKRGEREVKKELLAFCSSEQADKVLAFIKSPSKQEELERIIALLPGEYRKYVRPDLSIARGLDYYTGFVFETFVKGFENLGSVVSGGRYDRLIEKYGGEPVPATGFGLGSDRLAEIVNISGVRNPSVFIANVDAPAKARELCYALRALNVAAETDVMGRSISKQFDYAGRKGVSYVVVIGEKEVKSGKAMLRDMATGKEKPVALDARAIAASLRER
ncbi:MAG: histidine--tRNA ligase [Candidatus Aenigmarchaeota archaeon]|nr:histidine--tRNA ligase [Candidatus Aenigmarchaeota archaeon]